ncbi:MAG: hypothetical protein HZB67_06055 [Candidatus Aenigmarchaeota archaeon]|nr:hypothetical protein [Candidatus Aenigmarchaeota archaeon]
MRGISTPNVKSPLLSYETGVHIGDGTLSYSAEKAMYAIYFSGDLIEDFYFFNFTIKNIIKKLYGVEPITAFIENKRSISLRVYSKNLFMFKRDVIGLPVGPKVEMRNVISKNIELGEENISNLIAGLFDTDGCFKTFRKGEKIYPQVRMSNKSPIFSDIKAFLDLKGISSTLYKRPDMINVLDINGNKNTKSFFNSIPSRNIKHLTKYIIWCASKTIPSPKIEDRIKLLNLSKEDVVGISTDIDNLNLSHLIERTSMGL